MGNVSESFSTGSPGLSWIKAVKQCVFNTYLSGHQDMPAAA